MVYRDAFKEVKPEPERPRTVFLEVPEDVVRAYHAADKALGASAGALDEVTMKAKRARETYNHWRRTVDNPPVTSAAGVQEMWQRLGEAHVAQLRCDKEVAEWSDILARSERTFKQALELLEQHALKAANAMRDP